MILDRVQQILSSEETIPVTHKGTPIWIEKLNPMNQTALVTGKTGQYTVDITELIEQ
ncbi:H-type small acid-soluble spore protein [Anaerosolibacter carboniphilus]|uniref:H-type small acid-soluble spore protein n=1 Tax=Anaerosolibacter carboniphilus TaxID=1417629 RepID=A0A841L3J8_9FIRM|nr:H-type small acid-soluble spore protein [Anaerosolibacter carboniphilus]MBB6216915.1 H-type small acid-soluble spore protein [Anaerosolibacter carboniphilus]